MGEGRNPHVTVVTPVFNEEENLGRYEQEVRDVLLERHDVDFDVLLIDDGSADRSWALIEELCRREPRMRGVRLSRNFGSHVALSAGFALADADAVATLACDLQDPPEVVAEFVERWREGAHIVWGHRRSRGDSGWRVLASRIFFRLLSRYAMPKGSHFTTGSFLLADRRVVECFNQFREHNRITFAMIAWTGFRQAVVPYDRRRREAGVSGWSPGRMFKTMYDAFIGYSNLPVRLITLLGLCVSMFSALLAGYFLVAWLIDESFPGWTSIVVLITVFFGIQFLLMGLMGEYLYRVYTESVGRPLYFISEWAGRAGGPRREGPWKG